MRYQHIIEALAWAGIAVFLVQVAMADEPSFAVRHRPEVAALASRLGGEQSARLKATPKVFPYQRASTPDKTDGPGENFEVDVSDSGLCSRMGFLHNRITGIVYPRFYEHYSIDAALSFAADRVMGNQTQRGERDATVVAAKVAEESARISSTTALQDRLILVQLGQNEQTKVYFYSSGTSGTASVICHASDFYKRCSVEGNLPSLGFDTSIHKRVLEKPNVMSCYFLAFERIRREALVDQ